MGHRKGDRTMRGLRKRVSNQRIKEIFLEEEAPGLELEGWVGPGHGKTDQQVRPLHVEKVV